LRNADRDNAVRQRWPQETAALQSLREQARALAVMPNDLDQVTAAAPKNVEITSVRIPLQTLLNQTRKAREPAAHIGMAGRKPHPNIARSQSSAFKHVEDPRQRFRVNVCIHPDASPVAKIDLDQSVPGGR
jgi:hypothetical protein